MDVPICYRCGLTCEIKMHKAIIIQLPKETVYFHNAHAEDCYEQAKADARIVRAR